MPFTSTAPMIQTAEVVGKRYTVSRERQDRYALRSQQLTAKAQAEATTRIEPGPNGTSLAHVRAGMSELFSGDGRANVYEFFPKNTTVRGSDTICRARRRS